MKKEQHYEFDCWDKKGQTCIYFCGTKRFGISRQDWYHHIVSCGDTLEKCPGCSMEKPRNQIHERDQLMFYGAGPSVLELQRNENKQYTIDRKDYPITYPPLAPFF
jgi:hypothetical protein